MAQHSRSVTANVFVLGVAVGWAHSFVHVQFICVRLDIEVNFVVNFVVKRENKEFQMIESCLQLTSQGVIKELTARGRGAVVVEDEH
jgi:hypothetical protein